MTDLYPSQTAISLYYTLSGTQGAGVITGSATEATLAVSTIGGGSGSRSGTASSKTTATKAGSTTTGSAAGSGGSSTSSSKAGAAPTGVWMGALGVVAGGAVIAVL